jgi:hypothetical protein
MNIDYLSQLMTNRLAALMLAKDQAFQTGDLERINAVDTEILEVQNTLGQLNLIAGVTAAATATNTTAAEIIATGLDAVQTSVQGPSAGAVVNGYDISAYATDPLHEQKIQNLISGMPGFTTPADMDAYIQSAAPGSPVTGAMVQNSATLYGVDALLMLAIMQNDSNFGMLGVGARTNNPGNVGNTGSEERSYATWEDGVMAVAEWLSRHRYVAQEAVTVPVVSEEPPPEKPARKKKVVEEDPPEEEPEEPPVTEEPQPEPEPETPPEEPVLPPIGEQPPADTAPTTPPAEEPTASTSPSESTP